MKSLASNVAILSGVLAGFALSGAMAQQPQVTIMVGGIEKIIYLPAMLTEQLGYFKEQGLNVELITEPAGVDAENELLAGKVDGVVGFYDHTIDLQSKGKAVMSVVQFSRAPGEVVLVDSRKADQIKSAATPDFVVVAQSDSVTQSRELAPTLRPDLLLVDIYLPDGNGLELVQQLRAEGCHFEVIMITAASDVASIQEALERVRSRLSLTRQGRNFTQLHLDRLLGHQGGQRLPKGIDSLTLEQVHEVMRNTVEPLSAEEVGARVGLSRASAWRYLDYLSETQVLSAEMVHGSVGRPTKRYRLAHKS